VSFFLSSRAVSIKIVVGTQNKEIWIGKWITMGCRVLPLSIVEKKKVAKTMHLNDWRIKFVPIAAPVDSTM
jgi:hypothetical protein